VIRTEYQTLVDRLPALVHDLEGTISGPELRDLEIVMAAIECIDRVLDGLDDPARRSAFSAGVLAGLVEPAAIDDGTPELDRQLCRLREVIASRGVAEPFWGLAREALGNTESLRTTRDVADYLDRVEHEGRLTVELALLFFPPHTGARVVGFLRAIGDVANLVDKLLDARGDFVRGELALRPGVWFHVRLLGRLVRRIPRAAALHPRRLQFAAWGLSWLPPFRRA
jgi:hypothetical protein